MTLYRGHILLGVIFHAKNDASATTGLADIALNLRESENDNCQYSKADEWMPEPGSHSVCDSMPRGIELAHHIVPAVEGEQREYLVEVGVLAPNSLEAAWVAHSLWTGPELPVVTVTAPDLSQFHYDLAKEGPADDDGEGQEDE